MSLVVKALAPAAITGTHTHSAMPVQEVTPATEVNAPAALVDSVVAP